VEIDADNIEGVSHTISTDIAQITVSGEPKIGDEPARDQGVFIEVLDKHDGVLHRARYEQLPLSIGNTYRCDHIIDSEDVKPIVLRLEREDGGALVVRSRVANQRFWAPGGMTTEWTVDPDRAFMLAGERIRVRTRDYAPSRASTQSSAIQWLGGWASLFAIIAALAITALQGWVADIDGDRLSKYVTGALGTFGVIVIWAGIWALVSRLNGKSSHFLAHLSLASLGVVAISAIDFLFDSATFAFNWSTVSRYAYVLFAVCLGVLVWCHTRYVVRARVGVAATTAFAIALAIFASQATTYFALRGSLASGLTMNEMRPPAWRMVQGASIDEFFAGSADLQKRAEDSKPEKPEGFDFGTYGE
jgi:hypothetical protein